MDDKATLRMQNFKNASGRYYTRQLFWEEAVNIIPGRTSTEARFTLYKDKPGLINFGRAYVEEADPSGYKVSKRLLNGDYTLWTVLMGCRWFVTAKDFWDKELDAKLFSEGMDKIRELAESGMPAQKLAASKYLANKEYKKDRSTTKGRPTKEAVDRAAKDLATSDRDLDEDLRRIKGII